jgi:hypothetical protein
MIMSVSMSVLVFGQIAFSGGCAGDVRRSILFDCEADSCASSGSDGGILGESTPQAIGRKLQAALGHNPESSAR